MLIKIPDFALVVLMGATGSGKSTFAARHFLPTEVVASDRCRALVADDENDQSATADAFDLVHAIAGKRLGRRRLTVIDATNLRSEDRKPLVELARRYHALPVAIAFDTPEAVCLARNAARSDRQIAGRVVRDHVHRLRGALRGLEREGFRTVHILRGAEAAEAATPQRVPLWCDRRGDCGPFDIIGDIHGCRAELETLLGQLGYAPSEEAQGHAYAHPERRRVIFLGDFVDRGPDSPGVLRLAMDMVEAGTALAVPGNHDAKCVKWLGGKAVPLTHGLAETAEQFDALSPETRAPLRERARRFLDGLVSHLWLDGGRLVVAHAGLIESMQGRGSGAVRGFALYGDTTGESDDIGLPVRRDWAADYRGRAMVVYGHVPRSSTEWVNNTICIDTGCVFGGRLTALRYPERDLVDVPAARTYCVPPRPLAPAPAQPDGQQPADVWLDLEDVWGKRSVTTRLLGPVRVEAQNAAAALELMSRFAIDPRWLIHLPPTMSPPETSNRPGLLEHPAEAFDYYARAGIGTVVIEEKHMGSRAVLVLARDVAAAQRRFGVEDGRAGVVYTRTGRPFFIDIGLEAQLVGRIADAAGAAGLWEALGTDWLCLDAEIMPWSAKAQALIDAQYRPVSEAAIAGTGAAAAVLRQAAGRGVAVEDLLARVDVRAANALAYDAAWRRYCAPVAGIDDLAVAPFHLLASEAAVHADKSHAWHMDRLGALAAADPALLRATAWRRVALDEAMQVADAVAWWEALTAAGGEGMVVKPADFVTCGRKGLVQPAVKCRGPDYLRIIYGPDYTLPEHLDRLRKRGLGAKRGLASREFALGIEALERFVRGEPLRRVHECVFAVLALESEPVDPRL